jgi:hypothetical protein
MIMGIGRVSDEGAPLGDGALSGDLALLGDGC